MEVVLMKSNAGSLKARLARNTLERIRSQGHPYLELREDGKRYVFFCTLCLSPCYSDNALLDHLKGALHNRRLSAAKRTLLKPNPWPFNDGVSFFDCSNLFAKQLLETKSNEEPTYLAMVSYGGSIAPAEANYDLVIPRVLIMDSVADLKVKFIGTGRIGARFKEKEGETELLRIWCEWLGAEKNSQAFHDCGVVAFSYDYHLGSGKLEDLKIVKGPETAESHARKKGLRSLSDPDGSHESADSSGEEACSSNEQWMVPIDRSLSASKTIRHELRRQQRVTADRMCDICQQKMLPQKDAAALLNLKTGKLVCSSRNENGAFHVFHVSCLLHWILLCESEAVRIQCDSPKGKRRRKRKTCTADKGENFTVFCAECQGTGIPIKGDEFENPVFPLSEIFKLKIKMSDGRRGWMESPEELVNCSTGFCFSSSLLSDAQEKVVHLKLMQFYRAH